jgi:hypothetical protein
VNWLAESVNWWALFLAVSTGLAFVAVMVLGVVLTGFVLVRMPAHYFCDHYVRDIWVDRHPIVRTIGRVLKNLLGVLLITAGVGLALPGVPGPGLPVILFGITLVDFPGKRRWERWLIERPAVLSAINRLRHRYGQPPIARGCVSNSRDV